MRSAGHAPGLVAAPFFLSAFFAMPVLRAGGWLHGDRHRRNALIMNSSLIFSPVGDPRAISRASCTRPPRGVASGWLCPTCPGARGPTAGGCASRRRSRCRPHLIDVLEAQHLDLGGGALVEL